MGERGQSWKIEDRDRGQKKGERRQRWKIVNG